MIRGVAVVFGLVAIAILICVAVVVVSRTLEWWQRRRMRGEQ